MGWTRTGCHLLGWGEWLSRYQINEGKTSLMHTNRKRSAILEFDSKPKRLVMQNGEELTEVDSISHGDDTIYLSSAIES